MIYVISCKDVSKIESIQGIYIVDKYERASDYIEMAIYINKNLGADKIKSIVEQLKKNSMDCDNREEMLITAEVKSKTKIGIYNLLCKKTNIDCIKNLCSVIDEEEDEENGEEEDRFMRIYISERENVPKIMEFCKSFELEDIVID